MLKNQTTKLFLLGVLVLVVIAGATVALDGLTVGKTGDNCGQAQCDTTHCEQVQCDTTHCNSTKCDTVTCDKPVGK